MLEKSAQVVPEQIAFSDVEGALSYIDAVILSKSIGTRLARSNYRNQAVAVLLDKSKEMLISFFGAIYSGNFYIPIDVEMPNDRIEKIFSTVHPFAVVTDSTYAGKAALIAEKSDCEFKVIDYDEAVRAIEPQMIELYEGRNYELFNHYVEALFAYIKDHPDQEASAALLGVFINIDGIEVRYDAVVRGDALLTERVRNSVAANLYKPILAEAKKRNLVKSK